jgi:GT2 family glycosyltransferase
VREAWLGLATARRRLGDAAGAAEALGEALRRHVTDAALAGLADAIAGEAGAPGWCAMTPAGEVIRRFVPPLCHPVAAALRRRTKRRWLPITAPDGTPLLGSPIDLAAITAAVGCVSCEDGGLTGWAWHPGNPEIDPVLTIRPANGRRVLTITAADTSVRTEGIGLLARPRGFTVTAEVLRDLTGPVRVLDGSRGADLLGSPLDPQAELAAVASAIPVGMAPPRRNAAASRRLRPVDVVVAVHGGAMQTLACLDSVLANLPRWSRLIAVDDASPDGEVPGRLNALARRERIILIRQQRNLGFGASVNAGIRAAEDHDVVLLNSDTLVAPGWLAELRSVAYSAPDIGTVTPFSNDATLLSYPDPGGGNEVPDLAATMRLDALARSVNGGEAVEIPVGVGFCLYIRRACLDEVGRFRAELFAQGYGEENDFCLRARHLGWRHVAAPGAFVAHVGGHSFGTAARHLRARNAALLERLHPGHAALIDAHAVADPLADARRRLDLARWRRLRRRGREAVILITHMAGGGVERQIAASIERHLDRGVRAIVLRPARRADGTRCVAVCDGTSDAFPNLHLAMPDELPDLQRLLVRTHPTAIELHHLVGHHPAVLELIAGLGVPYDVNVHDYGWLCAQVALVGPAQRYCGEPEVTQCEICVAKGGNLIEEDISVAALRRRSARLLAGARRVVVPSADAAARIRRHFPAISPVPQPHEDDAAISDPPPPIARTPCRVCVIGAIGIHKGFQVVLDCAHDAAARNLSLEFVVVGHTIDDRALLETGRVFVTGQYAAHETVALIREQNATLTLLPSIFPETWCLSLGEAWRAGLRVVAFDIGAQAERIRNTGRGVLLPLGLPPDAVNDALIAAAGLSRR